jgi:hypothetical protein
MMRLGDAELRHRTSHHSQSKLVRPVVESGIPSLSHDVSVFYPRLLTSTDLARRVERSVRHMETSFMKTDDRCFLYGYRHGKWTMIVINHSTYFDHLICNTNI